MMDLIRLITMFHDACTKVGLGYAFIGGVAVMAWGEPRATRDVDALVKPHAPTLKALADELQQAGLLVDPHDFEAAFEDRPHVTVTDPSGHLHIDVKLAFHAAERAEIDEAEEVPLAGTSIRVASAEDTIAFKLAFGSQQDRRDARGIVWRMGPRLDQDRLTRAAVRAGVADQLEVLWEEAERLRDDAEGQP